MKILIVDDEKQLVSALKAIFKKKGIDSDCAYDGEEALEYARSGVYDVIILDWMLPKADGPEVLKRLRAMKISTPVIMLTAKSEIYDKISGLNVGADDYLTKPFDSEELFARIKALSRRRGEYFGEQLNFGDVALHTDTHELICGKQSTVLGVKEFRILEMLMKNPKMVFPKETIIEKIWGFDSDAEYNNVEVYVSFLRKKLAALGSAVTVKSLRNTGYRLGDTKVDKEDAD